MSFTIKQSMFAVRDPLPGHVLGSIEPIDTIAGPFSYVSVRLEDGCQVVTGHYASGEPGWTFGPFGGPEPDCGLEIPRPTIWVMNEAGATVAKYTL